MIRHVQATVRCIRLGGTFEGNFRCGAVINRENIRTTMNFYEYDVHEGVLLLRISGGVYPCCVIREPCYHLSANMIALAESHFGPTDLSDLYDLRVRGEP